MGEESAAEGQFEALDANGDGIVSLDEFKSLDTDGDGVVTGQEFSTVASASHKASATTAMNNVVRTFCKVSATVGIRGEAALGTSDEPGYQPARPAPAPQPAPQPEPEPEQAPAAGAGAAGGGGGGGAAFSDSDALAQLMGPPVSDALLQSLLNMSDADRMRLAEELLKSLSAEDLKALLQGMRRFEWEVDVECQTDHSGEIGTHDAHGNVMGAMQAVLAMERMNAAGEIVSHPHTTRHVRGTVPSTSRRTFAETLTRATPNMSSDPTHLYI